MIRRWLWTTSDDACGAFSSLYPDKRPGKLVAELKSVCVANAQKPFPASADTPTVGSKRSSDAPSAPDAYGSNKSADDGRRQPKGARRA